MLPSTVALARDLSYSSVRHTVTAVTVRVIPAPGGIADRTSLVYRIDDTIRIVDTLIRYTIRVAIHIVSFIQ